MFNDQGQAVTSEEIEASEMMELSNDQLEDVSGGKSYREYRDEGKSHIGSAFKSGFGLRRPKNTQPGGGMDPNGGMGPGGGMGGGY